MSRGGGGDEGGATQNQNQNQNDSWAATLHEVLAFRARGETTISSAQQNIGAVLQRIPVQSNSLYQLTLVCDIECEPGMVAPHMTVRLHNARSNWKKNFPLPITQQNGVWVARFVVPIDVVTMHIDLSFGAGTLWKRNQCRAILRTSRCRLHLVDGFTQLERNWVAAAAAAAAALPLEDEACGWSSLHHLVPHVYVLRHPRVTWADSRALQRALQHNGVRFHLIGGDNSDTLLAQTCCSHATRCNRCFYHDSTVWAHWNAQINNDGGGGAVADVHAPSQHEKREDAALDARILRQRLQEAAMHARAEGAQRVLFLTDAVRLTQAWEEGVRMHLGVVPSSWAYLRFDTAAPVNGAPAASLFTPLEQQQQQQQPPPPPQPKNEENIDFPHAFAIGTRTALAQVTSRLLVGDSVAPINNDYLASLGSIGSVALEWRPSLFHAHAAPSTWFGGVAATTNTPAEPLLHIILPVEASMSLRQLERLVRAYIAQSCGAWTLTLLVAKDHIVIAPRLAPALLCEWAGGDVAEVRVKLQWIAQQADLVSSLCTYARSLCTLGKTPAPFLLLARSGYLPMPHQVRTLLEISRTMDKSKSSQPQLFVHTGPNRDMMRVCAPATTLKHTLFGVTRDLACAIVNAAAAVEGDLGALLSEVHKQTKPAPRALSHVLSCADPSSN